MRPPATGLAVGVGVVGDAGLGDVVGVADGATVGDDDGAGVGATVAVGVGVGVGVDDVPAVTAAVDALHRVSAFVPLSA
jgi:hypothetical protein